ncbi:MAG: T9SS type A sorting domain-containing protein [Muribaculaceae bacterium]|nr:T9SS type A sorting domain-containing protein [Muribaculaceae bacterium]
MKQIDSAKLGWLTSFVFLSCLFCKAETKVPCLIFSGNAEKEVCIDLATLNRITFGDNSMIVSSSKDPNTESIELLYSLYHHLEIGDGTPSDFESSIDVILDDSNSRIYLDAQSKLLYLQTTLDSEFQIGIFNVSGNLLLTSELSNGDALMLETLSSGVYIAVATDGKTKISLKFILK